MGVKCAGARTKCVYAFVTIKAGVCVCVYVCGCTCVCASLWKINNRGSERKRSHRHIYWSHGLKVKVKLVCRCELCSLDTTCFTIADTALSVCVCVNVCVCCECVRL